MDRRFTSTLLAAALAHALALLSLSVWKDLTSRTRHDVDAANSRERQRAVELTWLDLETTSQSPAPHVAQSPSETPEPKSSVEPARTAKAVASQARSAAVAALLPPAPSSSSTGEIAGSPSAGAASDEASATQLPDAQPSQASSGADESRLSLDDMGLGKSNPFLGAIESPDAVALAEDRLERNMAQAILEHDQHRSLGAEGPVIRALTHSAMGASPPRSKARFLVVTNEHGYVGHVEVLSTNLGFNEWTSVAEKALAALSQIQLRAPEGRRLELILDVESKVALPSGRAPGKSVSVLGIPLSESEFEDSTKIEILSPKLKLEMVKVPKPGSSGETMEIPAIQVGITVLGVNGDLADVLAPARQVVHTKLVRQRVL